MVAGLARGKGLAHPAIDPNIAAAQPLLPDQLIDALRCRGQSNRRAIEQSLDLCAPLRWVVPGEGRCGRREQQRAGQGRAQTAQAGADARRGDRRARQTRRTDRAG
ncbi:MAG: hypothetical protein R3E83_16895 [Burkholderiaceae bacterium]